MVAVRHDGGGKNYKKSSYSPGLSGFNQQIAKIPAYKPPTIPTFNFTQPAAPNYQGYAAPAAAPAPVYNGGGGAGYSAGAGFTGGGGGSGFAAPAARPVISEADWLKGDSDYQAQENEYNRALKLFEDRINKKKKMFDDDYDLSKGVTQKNQGQAMTGVGEDFAARGLAYSGLFDTARTDTEDMFKRQLGNLEMVRGRNVGQADDDFADFRQETELSRGNAKRNALARFANQQSLY